MLTILFHITHNFCKSAFKSFIRHGIFIDLVQRHNIPYHEKTLGQLFCDNKSKDILDMLLGECEVVAATVQLNTTVHQVVQQIDQRFMVSTSTGDIDCQSLVIASGGFIHP